MLYEKTRVKHEEERDVINSRVMLMERYFVTVQDILNNDNINICENVEILEMIHILKEYQDSGQWLKDYQCDEKGIIPLDLKRGVLSEDGLYNLLDEVESVLSTR